MLETLGAVLLVQTPEEKQSCQPGLRIVTKKNTEELTLSDQLLPDLPGEDGGVLPLVALDLGHDLRGGDLGLGPTDHPGRPPSSSAAAALLRRRDLAYPGGRRQDRGCGGRRVRRHPRRRRRPRRRLRRLGRRRRGHPGGRQVALLKLVQLPLLRQS